MLFLYGMRRQVYCVVLVILGLAVSAIAEAHKVNMFAYVDGDRVFIEGYFSDGNKARNSEVAVYNEAGDKVLTGVTGEDGAYSFKIPAKGALRITLNAGMGHKTDYTVSADELAGETKLDTSTVGDASPTDSQPRPDNAGDTAGPTKGPEPSEADLELMVRRAVGDAIKPLMRSVSELEARRGFSDIVGGIGFIIGILGTVFYLKARKLSQNKSEKTGS